MIPLFSTSNMVERTLVEQIKNFISYFAKRKKEERKTIILQERRSTILKIKYPCKFFFLDKEKEKKSLVTLPSVDLSRRAKI